MSQWRLSGNFTLSSNAGSQFSHFRRILLCLQIAVVILQDHLGDNLIWQSHRLKCQPWKWSNEETQKNCKTMKAFKTKRDECVRHYDVCLMSVLFVSKMNITPRINKYLKDTIKFKYVFSYVLFTKKIN